MKRPLVACLVGYAGLSELCASHLNRQLGAFNMSIPLTNTSSDEVNVSSTLSQQCFSCFTYLGLTYSLPPTLKLTASVAVISVAVVADVDSVESSAYIDTLALLIETLALLYSKWVLISNWDK